MSSPSRRESASVVQKLISAPYAFTFAQAVRLLERSAALNKKDSNKDSRKYHSTRQQTGTSDSIRFLGNQSLSFQAADIKKIEPSHTKSKDSRWNMHVNFMGLTGSMGVLPYHYSELIQRRRKIKDESLSRFLDIFNHRLVSLFYEASSKYKLPISYERSRVSMDRRKTVDTHTQALLALMGLGTPFLAQRSYISDESLLYYSGLFSQSVRTVDSLKQILQHHFGITVQIEQFMGQWQELIDDVRTRLPGKDAPKGQNNQLGCSLMIGSKGWFAQGKIRIILGPLSKDQLHKFAPGTNALRSLNEIVRLYIGLEHSYDFVIRIKRSEISETVQLSASKQPVLGWDTWIGNIKDRFTCNSTIDITVSANRIR